MSSDFMDSYEVKMAARRASAVNRVFANQEARRAEAEREVQAAMEEHRQQMDKHLRIVSDMVEYEVDPRDEEGSDVRPELERYR